MWRLLISAFVNMRKNSPCRPRDSNPASLTAALLVMCTLLPTINLLDALAPGTNLPLAVSRRWGYILRVPTWRQDPAASRLYHCSTHWNRPTCRPCCTVSTRNLLLAAPASPCAPCLTACNTWTTVSAWLLYADQANICSRSSPTLTTHAQAKAICVRQASRLTFWFIT